MDTNSSTSDNRDTSTISVTIKTKTHKHEKPRKLKRITKSVNLFKSSNQVQPVDDKNHIKPRNDKNKEQSVDDKKQVKRLDNDNVHGKHKEDKSNDQTNSDKKDLYQHILDYRRKYCIDKTPGESGIVESDRNIDNNVDNIEILELSDTEQVNEECDRSIKDDISNTNQPADNSSPSSPSWTDISPCDSPVNDELGTNKTDNDNDMAAYLFFRYHGFTYFGKGEELDSHDNTQQNVNDSAKINDPDGDVAIMVGEKQEVINAHSQILINQSKEFSDLLSDQNHLRSKVVMLPDLRKGVVENIIRFFYGENIELTVELALAILHESNYIGSQAIREECLWFLLIDITPSIACDVLEYAHKYDSDEVYDQCLRFIHVNAVEVFKENNFCNLCEHCVNEITKSDYLRAEEILVFETLMSYADRKCKKQKLELVDTNRRKVLGAMFFNVRFAVLDLEVFVDSINKRRLLDHNEKKDILLLINGKPLKKKHSYNIEPRKKYKIKQYFSKVRLANSRNTIQSEASGTELQDENISPLLHYDSGVGSQTPGSSDLVHTNITMATRT